MVYASNEERRAARSASERKYYFANQKAQREKKRAYWNNLDPAKRAEARAKKKAYNAERLSKPDTWVIVTLNSARVRAKKKGIEFLLSPEDVHIPDVCPFTLKPFYFGPRNGGPNPQSPSLDRIKPNQGYVRDNVRVISFLANAAKQNITDPDVFQRLADDARLWSLV